MSDVGVIYILVFGISLKQLFIYSIVLFLIYSFSYKSPAIKGQLTIADGQLHIHFNEPVWGVAPGQSLVIYKDGLLVGGGIIEEV